MGCQVFIGEQGVFYSRGAWLVAAMCQPWFDQVRDTDSDGWYQDSINEVALKAADKCVPWVFEKFLDWAQTNNVLLPSARGEIDRYDFNQCRKFLKYAANQHRNACLSH